MELMTNDEKKNNLIIYHENIRCLHNNKEELYTMISGKTSQFSFLYFSEHHTKWCEINNFSMPGYNLVANFCQKKYLKVGVHILARMDALYKTTDLRKYWKDKILEICAVKLKSNSNNLILYCTYRAPSGNIHKFQDLLDGALKCLHPFSLEFILCGDININYLTENNINIRLDMIMNAYILKQVVDFPDRIFTDMVKVDVIFRVKVK